MTRQLSILALVALLACTGCDKVKSLTQRNKAPSTPAPSEAVAAPAEEPSLDEPAAANAVAENETAAKTAVDTKSEVVVLCYHRLEGKAGGINSIEPALFEQQMQEIKDSGIPVISMQDFLAWRRGEKTIPPRAIIITLDDGYVSELEVGVPILKKHGFPATFFVYLDFINKGGKSVTWAQLGELRDQGFDIGSHTVMHADLRRKPAKAPGDYDAWLKDELERSKKTIEERLGISCATIAYPYGNHNPKVQEATRAAGYEAGFTTYGARLGHGTNALTLGRYDVTAKMPGNQSAFTVAISFAGMVAPGADPVMAQDAATSMVTQPMSGEVITDASPTIKANISTMGVLDAGSVVMRVSGFGLVPAKLDAATKTISYTVEKPLRPGTYVVIIGAKSNGRPVEARWSFEYNPAGGTSPADVELPPRAAATPVAAPAKKK
jgi:peptidoglycan/xylan/chitin deacetylase (PgdA/CDA1 family)